MKKDNNNSFFKKYPLICLSSMNSEFFTFPIDSIKTRMQINNNNRSFFSTGISLVKKNGFFSLYRGIQPAILRHWVYTGSRISLYESIRKGFYENGYSENDIFPKITASVLAGSIGQFIASPTDLVKIRKKEDFVRNNLNTFLDFFKIKDIIDWKIKKGFLIRQNFPTIHIINIDADFVFISELDSYLKK